MSDDRGAMDLYVETAPFPQTIECPKCDAEMRFLIESTDIGGTRCVECGVDIDYVHDRHGGTAVDETEQDTLVTDGGVDRDDAGVEHLPSQEFGHCRQGYAVEFNFDGVCACRTLTMELRSEAEVFKQLLKSKDDTSSVRVVRDE